MTHRALRYPGLRDVQEDVARAAATLFSNEPDDVFLGADHGWWAATVSDDLGGTGGSLSDIAPMIEEAGAGAVSSALPWTVGVVVRMLCLSSDDRTAILLRHIAAGRLVVSVPAMDGRRLAGEIGAIGTEDGVDASVLALGPPGWLLLPVIASGSPSLAVLGPDTPGLGTTPVHGFDVSRPWTRYDLHHVRLADAVMVTNPQLFSAWQAALGITCALDSAGAARTALTRTVEYSSARQQFGRPLGSFQAYKHQCANALVELTLAQSLAYRAVRAVDTPEELRLGLACAMQSTRSATAVCETAIQLHGGIGFSWESGLHRYLRRARTNEILVGGEVTAAMLLDEVVRP